MGIMMAHIANAAAPKKDGNWRREDFVSLRRDTSGEERKPSMKEAKKLLGSKWKLSRDGQ